MTNSVLHPAFSTEMSGVPAANVVDGISGRDIRFFAADGFPLSGTLFENVQGRGPLLLVSSAAAVERRFYARFAIAAAKAGARAVLIYDYRGVGQSQAPKYWRERLNMKDWGVLDLNAAADRLQAVEPGRELAGIGQSIGGIAFGLIPNPQRFARWTMVASGHGALRHTNEAFRLWFSLNVLARPIAALIGHVPGWLGLGTRLPRSIIQDWARFTRSKDYICNDPTVPEARGFARTRTPILAIGFSDDPWTTERSLDALIAKFPAAPVIKRFLTPAMAGLEKIGHLGFFRPAAGERLWPAVLEWLLAGRTPEFRVAEAA